MVAVSWFILAVFLVGEGLREGSRGNARDCEGSRGIARDREGLRGIARECEGLVKGNFEISQRET